MNFPLAASYLLNVLTYRYCVKSQRAKWLGHRSIGKMTVVIRLHVGIHALNRLGPLKW